MQEIEIYNKTGEIIDISVPVEENNIGAVKIAEFQKYKTHIDIDFFLGEINTIIFNETGSGSDKNAKRLFRQKVLNEIKNHINIRELFKRFFNYLCGGSNNLNDFQNNPLILIPVGGNPITLFFRLIIHIADVTDNDYKKILLDKFKGDIDFNTLKEECNLIKPNIIANKRFLSLSDCDFNLMPIITEEAKRPKKRRRTGNTINTETTKEVANAGFILTRLKAAFKKNVEKDKDKDEYKEKCFRSLIYILKTYPDVDTINYLYKNHFIFQQLQRGNLNEIIQNIRKNKNIEEEKKEQAIAYIEFLKMQKTEVASTTKEIINMIASYYDPINNTFQVQDYEEAKKKKSLFDSLSKNEIDKKSLQHFLNLTAFIRQLCLRVNQMLLTKKGPFDLKDTDQTIRSSRLRSAVFNIYEILLTDSTIDITGLLILLKNKYKGDTPMDFNISIINTQNNGYLKKFKTELDKFKNTEDLKGAKITANILSLNVGKSENELKQILLKDIENGDNEFIEFIEDLNDNYSNYYNRNIKPLNNYQLDQDPYFQDISTEEENETLTLLSPDEVAEYFGGRKKLNKTKRKKKKKHKHTKKRKKYISRKKHKTRKKKL